MLFPDQCHSEDQDQYNTECIVLRIHNDFTAGPEQHIHELANPTTTTTYRPALDISFGHDVKDGVEGWPDT